MTAPVFDRAHGILRVTSEHLSCMAAVRAGIGHLAEPLAEELSRAGILVEGRLHPALEAAARAVAEAQVRVSLVAETTAARSETVGWVDATTAVLIVRRDLSSDLGDAIVTSRSLLPQTLGGLVELGPRPDVKGDESVEIDEQLLEVLLRPRQTFAPEEVEALLDEDIFSRPWIELLARMSTSLRSHWMAGAWWDAPAESPVARAIEVIDLNDGLVAVGRRRREGARWPSARLRPVRASEVWRILVGLLPRPDEVLERRGRASVRGGRTDL